eukprot:gene6649-3308_t
MVRATKAPRDIRTCLGTICEQRKRVPTMHRSSMISAPMSDAASEPRASPSPGSGSLTGKDKKSGLRKLLSSFGRKTSKSRDGSAGALSTFGSHGQAQSVTRTVTPSASSFASSSRLSPAVPQGPPGSPPACSAPIMAPSTGTSTAAGSMPAMPTSPAVNTQPDPFWVGLPPPSQPAPAVPAASPRAPPPNAPPASAPVIFTGIKDLLHQADLAGQLESPSPSAAGCLATVREELSQINSSNDSGSASVPKAGKPRPSHDSKFLRSSLLKTSNTNDKARVSLDSDWDYMGSDGGHVGEHHLTQDNLVSTKDNVPRFQDIASASNSAGHPFEGNQGGEDKSGAAAPRQYSSDSNTVHLRSTELADKMLYMQQHVKELTNEQLLHPMVYMQQHMKELTNEQLL